MLEITFPVAILKKVVVIDDNNDILQLLTRYAKNSRYHVLTCSQPNAALSLIEHEQPDLVVLDVMMSSLDGWQLYHQIRKSIFGTRPVIFCTVLGQERLAKTLGADDYIRKPVSRENFLATLDRQWLINEQ